jgi:hypothetical protein
MRYNDELYFAHIEGIVESVDELCSMEITNRNSSYLFRIAPSLPKYTNLLIEEILKFNNRLGIKLNLSKSIKTSSVIYFDINI